MINTNQSKFHKNMKANVDPLLVSWVTKTSSFSLSPTHTQACTRTHTHTHKLICQLTQEGIRKKIKLISSTLKPHKHDFWIQCWLTTCTNWHTPNWVAIHINPKEEDFLVRESLKPLNRPLNGDHRELAEEHRPKCTGSAPTNHLTFRRGNKPEVVKISTPKRETVLSWTKLGHTHTHTPLYLLTYILSSGGAAKNKRN